MKEIIRLTESDLNNIVKKVISEIGDTYNGVSALGRVAGRAHANGDMATYGKAYGRFNSAENDRNANDEAGEFDYDGFFDYEQDRQYYYTLMLRDKEFLNKLVDVYKAYTEGYGYEEMEEYFMENFDE